jgi:hypothetical protein
MTRTLLTSLALGAALVAAAPASAATISFTGGNSSTDGTDGNVRIFSGGGVNLQATAWDYSGNTLQKAYLGRYSNGLGVTTVGEGNGASNNSHTTDNYGQKDFILLVFDKAVNITSAILTPYSVNGNAAADNDATISYASANIFASGNPSVTAINTNNGVFASLLGVDWTVSGTNSGNFSTALNSAGKFGNVWLIGAAFANPDNKYDGFKLSSITFGVTSVPEPSTWAMMIAGFGMVGAGMRRRSRVALTA